MFNQWFQTLERERIDELKERLGYNYKDYLLSAFLDISDLPPEMEIVYDATLLEKPFADYEEDMEGLYQQFLQAIVDEINAYYELSGSQEFRNIEEISDLGFLSGSPSGKSGFEKIRLEKSIVKRLEACEGLCQKVRKGELDSAIIFKSTRSKVQKGELELPKLGKDDANALSEECITRYEKLKLSERLEEYHMAVYAMIMKYACEMRRWYQEHAQSNYITNDLLLQKTRDLVCKNESARERITNKYKCLYVDEFQDVDAVQAELVLALAAKSLNTTELREGALFVVGDPTQTIYRFRGAEPALYHEVKERMKESLSD